jgi:hypothetical protein
MPEVGEALDWIVQQVESLVERFNDHLELEAVARKASRKRKPPLPKSIDLGAVRVAARPNAESRASLLVDMARRGAQDDGRTQAGAGMRGAASADLAVGVSSERSI